MRGSSCRQVFLEQLELVGGLERIVAADRDEGIDAQRSQSLVNRSQGRRAVGVGQMAGMRDVLAGVGPGRADHDAPRVARPTELVLIENQVIASLLHGVAGAEFDEVGVSVQDSHDLDSVAQKRGRGRSDDRVGRRRRAAGEQNGDAADLARACRFGRRI